MTTTHDTTVLPETHEPARKGRIEWIKERRNRKYHHWSYDPIVLIGVIAVGIVVGWIIWLMAQSPTVIHRGWFNIWLFVALVALSVGIATAFLASKRKKNPPIIPPPDSETIVVSESTDS